MVRWQIAGVLGVLASVAITGLALIVETDRIEADLAARSAAVLDTEVTSWARLDVNGRDVQLAGDAPTDDLRSMAVQRVERLFGVRAVDATAATLLPEQVPFRTTLTRRAGTLTIGGYAPSRPDRRRMVDALTTAAPGLAFDDDLTLARGLPDKDYLTAYAALLPLVGDLANGDIVLEDRSVRIVGEAATNAAYDRFDRLSLDLPPDYAVAGIEVTRPVADPYVFSAELAEGGISLTGVAPDPAGRGRLLSAARANARGGVIRDSIDLASGMPAGFIDAAVAGMDFMDLLASGRLDLRDGSISVQGVAATPETYRTINSHLAAWRPAGFTVEATIDLPVVDPFALSAARDGDQVTVTGFVPSADANDAVRRAAERVAAVRGAVVETTLASGAPDGFAEAADFAIGLLRHLSSGTATLVDDRITLSGVAAGSGGLLEIDAALASATPDGFAATSNVTPPIVSPYVWSLERTEDSLQISGHVPNEAVRAAVREAVERVAGDLGVIDRTTVAGGLPAGIDLTNVATFAASEAARLDGGRVTLSDGELSIQGRTDDAMAGLSIREAFRSGLPAGVVGGTVEVASPPAFQLRIERREDALAVVGTVADAAMADRIATEVQRGFGRVDAALELNASEGLPENAAEAAELAVRAASLLATGTVTVEGAVITVVGKAFTGVGAVRLSSDIAAAVPRGYRLDTSIGVARRGEPLTADQCEAAMDGMLSRNTILFEDGQATIAQSSHGLLDRIGAIALRCRDARFVVEGRPEEGGDAETGRALAEARAKAVAAFLEQVGVRAERLAASAVGAERPATDTTTPEGDARNRRIEIRVEPGPLSP